MPCLDVLTRTARFASRTAVTSGGSRYSYTSILESSEELAGKLTRLSGFQAGASSAPPRIGLYAEPGPEYVAGTYAIWQAGGIAVPLATSHPPAELSYVFEDAGLSAVLAPENAHGKFELLTAKHRIPLLDVSRLKTIDTIVADINPPLNGHRPLSGTDRGALIIYTSGTTGKPKGVLHTHKSMAAQMNSLISAWEWSAQDKILHTLPLHHIHGIVNALYCPLAVGAHVQVLPKFSPSVVWNKIISGELSVFMGVPTMYSYLLTVYDSMKPDQQAEAREAASKLRLTVSGSSACPVPIMQKWKELSGRVLLERYGMTEIGMGLSNPYHGDRRPGAVGLPLPGVTAKISADGELLIRGDTVFKEYWGRPEATEEAFDSEGYFRTGDTVGLGGEPPYYSILGRTSVDIIKSAGFKISALQIESVILEHPNVAEVAVLGVPDDVYGEVVTALVVLKSDDAGNSKVVPKEELQSFCRDKLAGYQIPKRWAFMAALPRNAMGKVNKKEMLKTYLAEGEAEAAAAS